MPQRLHCSMRAAPFELLLHIVSVHAKVRPYKLQLCSFQVHVCSRHQTLLELHTRQLRRAVVSNSIVLRKQRSAGL